MCFYGLFCWNSGLTLLVVAVATEDTLVYDCRLNILGIWREPSGFIVWQSPKAQLARKRSGKRTDTQLELIYLSIRATLALESGSLRTTHRRGKLA